MYSSPEARNAEIELGSTLPPEALRNLVEHSAIDLDVRWRDLPDDRWVQPVRTAQGRTVPASETVWLRCREVWLHAVDLESGARLDQVPAAVLTRLIDDVLSVWKARGTHPLPHLLASDAAAEWGAPSHDAETVEGPLSALAAWATGRLPADARMTALQWSGEPAPAPRWI